MIAVDTNILLRYLIQPIDKNNPRWQVEAAINLINASETVYLSDIVIVEIEWVLESVFGCSRTEIAEAVFALASNQKFKFESWNALHCALMDYREFSKVDLSDCLIARRAKESGSQTLYTFESQSKLGGTPCATTLLPE
jgi:predicted nucleic-acid-binding protein